MNMYETTITCTKKSTHKCKKLNKFKFIRFMLICVIILSLIIWGIMSIIHNMTIKHDINNIHTNIEDVNIGSMIPVTNVYAHTVDDKNTDLYNNKPNNLSDICYNHIISIANDEQIPAAVILAIITVENEIYDVNAKYVNANGTVDMGLCQINSACIDYFAKEYDIENLDPYDAHDAIVFVARHMKKLSNYGKDEYHLSDEESYIFAAGAYNRGLKNECVYRNMYDYKYKFITYYEKFSV